MNHALIEKKKILAYLNEENKKIAEKYGYRFDKIFSDADARLAGFILHLKLDIEEGKLDCTELIETNYHGKPYAGGFDP